MATICVSFVSPAKLLRFGLESVAGQEVNGLHDGAEPDPHYEVNFPQYWGSPLIFTAQVLASGSTPAELDSWLLLTRS